MAHSLLSKSQKANGLGSFRSTEVLSMNNFLIVILVSVFALSGCQFLGGAATGALATGAGYEIQAKRQMDRLEDDFKSGRISREEYESRKRQIESGSIVY
jgi:hypothetical protein